MRIIIIGASGLIGYELFKLASATNRQVIGTYDTYKRDGLIHFNMIEKNWNHISDTVLL